MWPLAFRVGSFEVGSYGILLVLSTYAALALASYLGARNGLIAAEVRRLGILTILGGVAGAKLLDTIVASIDAGRFVFRGIREAGAIHGGVIGASLTAYLVIRHYRMPVRAVFDALSPATALGQAVGRVGCFLAGCCFGSETESTLGVVYSSPLAASQTGTPLYVRLHPVQLYDFAAHGILALALSLVHVKGVLPGRIPFAYLLAEGIVRFTLEGFRGDPGRGIWALGLSTGRLTALAFAIVGAVGLLALRPRDKSPLPKG